MQSTPHNMGNKVLHIKKIEGKPGSVYYPYVFSRYIRFNETRTDNQYSLVLRDDPKPSPGPGQLLVRLTAAALNHRDLFIRQHLYPGISFTAPLLADGSGVVTAAGPDCKRPSFLNKPVIINPNRGWESDPVAPESGAMGAIGGTKVTEEGCAQEWLVVNEEDVEELPKHLTPAEAAALPLVGLTGWRAFVSKSEAAKKGSNVLITGIGGGVALQTLQFAVGFGANVYVTSGDQAKIDKAKSLGAKGGVIYKEKDWEKQLKALLPSDRPFLDAIIDGAGGPLVSKAVKVLKQGGIISQYGMTVSPKMDWLMSANLGQMELRGSTMGSRREFRDMIKFVNEKGIKPVVSRTVKGLEDLEGINGLFSDMKDGKQFGKLVIEIDSGASAKL